MKQKNPIVAAILLVIVSLIFVALFFLSSSLQDYDKNFSSDNGNLTSKENESLTGNTSNEVNNRQSCLELGCSENTRYVGSINSDKFYYCTCHYADRIHEENIICFETKQEAQQENYSYVDCWI